MISFRRNKDVRWYFYPVFSVSPSLAVAGIVPSPIPRGHLANAADSNLASALRSSEDNLMFFVNVRICMEFHRGELTMAASTICG
jgi:hypothetical protein